MTIRACLFDMDGVVRHWDPEHPRKAEDAAGIARGSLATAFDIPQYRASLLGDVSFDDWCAATVDALAPAWGKAAATRAVDTWHASLGKVDPDVLAVVRAVRGQARVGLLSNAHDCLWRDLRALAVDDVFDAVICSAEVGLVKPDAAIYAHAARVLGVGPSECFFVDDLAENVTGAMSAGLDAVQFTNPPDLADALKQRGFQVPDLGR